MHPSQGTRNQTPGIQLRCKYSSKFIRRNPVRFASPELNLSSFNP